MADSSQQPGVPKKLRRRWERALTLELSLEEKVTALICWREGYPVGEAVPFIGWEHRAHELLTSLKSKVRIEDEHEQEVNRRSRDEQRRQRRHDRNRNRRKRQAGCQVRGCRGNAHARQLCGFHYQEWKGAGRPPMTVFVRELATESES